MMMKLVTHVVLVALVDLRIVLHRNANCPFSSHFACLAEIGKGFAGQVAFATTAAADRRLVLA